LKKFKEHVEKKMCFYGAIHGNWEAFQAIQRALQAPESDQLKALSIKGRLINHNPPNEILDQFPPTESNQSGVLNMDDPHIESLDNVVNSPEIDTIASSAPSSKRKTRDEKMSIVIQKFGQALVDQVLDERVELCAKCFSTRSINGILQSGHTPYGCDEGAASKEDKQRMNSMYKAIKRAHNS
jgi:hypothetical protein